MRLTEIQNHRLTVPIKDWVTMCYGCFDRKPEFVSVSAEIEQRVILVKVEQLFDIGSRTYLCERLFGMLGNKDF